MTDAPPATETPPISRDTKIQLWVAVCMALVVGGWVMRDAVWKTQIEGRLTAIELQLSLRTQDRWTSHDMEVWATQLRADNPSLAVPKVQ
jgi:hypothetical protein